MKPWYALVALLLLLAPAGAAADEGMWTFDNVPSAKLRQAYAFTPSRAWLDHVRLSSVRLPGCSASFVSEQGLVMTNHHCTVGCVQQLSSPEHNYAEAGFYAKTGADEPKCLGVTLDRLDSISDVTGRVRAATANRAGAAYNDALRAESARIVQSCGSDAAVRCQVVNLYHGGVYDLYRYRRYSDVRMVFAPEFAIAQFGGDPDNFSFPRFDFDVSFLRAYEGDAPARTPEFLHWSKRGTKAGDLAVVVGNPGRTSRELTVAQVETLRDAQLPARLLGIAEQRGMLEQYGSTSPEAGRAVQSQLFFLENTLKELNGEESALLDRDFFAKLVAREDALRAAVARQPDLRSASRAWNDIAALQMHKRELALRAGFIGQGMAFGGRLFGFAQSLVRAAAERGKPNTQRLPEYSDAALAGLGVRLAAPSRIVPSLERLNLGFSLKKTRETLGADDPFVRDVLGAESPEQLAGELVAGTTLADPAIRKALFDGGQAAIDASSDPMIRLAARLDPQMRRVRKSYEDEIGAPESKSAEKIAQARFAVEGTSVYPDATFTLRFSYGSVKGFRQGGRDVAPYTTVAGLYERATGAAPYALPASWIAAKSALDPNLPFNVTTDNDIIGGNSGSPLIDRRGEVAGVIFDGNRFSLGGDFGFDARLNRAIALDERAILAGLRDVYHADPLVRELDK